MATIRVSKSTNYSCINNYPIRDSALSWAARGLLIYLLSMPDDWTVSVEHLTSQGPTGKKGLWTLLQELENQGYLTRTKKQGEQGRWKWEHVLREVPSTENTENPKETPYTPSRCMDEAGTVKGGIYQVPNNQVLKKERTPLPPETANGEPPPTEQSNDLEPQPVPPFKGVEFRVALDLFRRHRKEMKEPLTPLAEKLLFKKLAKWPESIAVQALEDAVLNRWRGVFEPRRNGSYLPTQAEMNAGGRGKLVI